MLNTFDLLREDEKRKAVYKARFNTFKYLKDLNLLNSELISILNVFYKKVLRDPFQYKKEMDKLNSVLSEKFNSDFSQRVLLAINVEVAGICCNISNKHFLENALQWARLNKLIFYILVVGITFLIRPFWAFAGQDSPGESTKKVVQTPYAISTDSYQIDVAHNLAAINAERAEIKEFVTHSSPQKLPKKEHSDFIPSDLDKENVQDKFASITGSSNLNFSSNSVLASQKTSQGRRLNFPPTQNLSSSSSKIPLPAVSVRLKGVTPPVRRLMIKAKPDWRSIKPLVNRAGDPGEFLSDALQVFLEMDPSVQEMETKRLIHRYKKAFRATELLAKTPEYTQECFKYSVTSALLNLQ